MICRCYSGPVAAIDFGRLLVDIRHGGGPYRVPDFGRVSDETRAFASLPSADEVVCSDSIDVDITGAQLLALGSGGGVDWALELSKNGDDLQNRLIPRCGVQMAVVKVSGAMGWCAAVKVGNVQMVASPQQLQIMQQISDGVFSKGDYLTPDSAESEDEDEDEDEPLFKSSDTVELAPELFPPPMLSSNTFVVHFPAITMVALDDRYAKLVSAQITQLQLAGHWSDMPKVCFGLQQFKLLHVPDNRILAQSVVSPATAGGGCPSDEPIESLAVIKYEQTNSLTDANEVEHGLEFRFADFEAAWYPDVVEKLHRLYVLQPAPSVVPPLPPSLLTHGLVLEPLEGLEPEPEPEPDSIGTFRVLHAMMVREGLEMDTPPAGQLEIGSVITGLAEGISSKSRTKRIRCYAGWVSLRATDGTLLLEKISKGGLGAREQMDTPPDPESPRKDTADTTVAWRRRLSIDNRRGMVMTFNVRASLAGFTLQLYLKERLKFSFCLRTMVLEHCYRGPGVHTTTAELQSMSLEDTRAGSFYPTIVGLLSDEVASLITFKFVSDGHSPRQQKLGSEHRIKRSATVQFSPMQLVLDHAVLTDLVGYFEDGVSNLCVATPISPTQLRTLHPR